MLILKSINEKPTERDGYRLLATCTWPKGFPSSWADGFNAGLAPSQELYDKLIAKKITFDDFSKQYLADLEAHKERLVKLAKQSRDFNITLVTYPDFEGNSIGKILFDKCNSIPEKD